MTEQIEDNEQWKLQGDCKKCKRQRYCTKGCKANRVESERFVNRMVAEAMVKKLYGKLFGKRGESND